MAKIKRKKVLAAKTETTIGTAETLAASDAQFNAYDIEVDPDIEFIPRDVAQCCNVKNVTLFVCALFFNRETVAR